MGLVLALEELEDYQRLGAAVAMVLGGVNAGELRLGRPPAQQGEYVLLEQTNLSALCSGGALLTRSGEHIGTLRIRAHRAEAT
jgi:predicted DNA-binding protein with PD1-like motif